MGTVVPAVRGFFASFQSGGGPSAITASFGGLVAFFRGQVAPAVMAIVTAVEGFVAVALPIVQAFVAGMMARIRPMIPTIRAIFAQIGAVIVSVMGLIQAVIQRVTTIIAFVWSRWGAQIMNFAAAVFGKILVVIRPRSVSSKASSRPSPASSRVTGLGRGTESNRSCPAPGT